MTDFSPLNFPLPERTGAEGLDARVTALEETIVRLLEALQYTLTNLGRENFNPAALERLRAEPMPEGELSLVKNIMAGEMMRILDGPFGIADVTTENLLCGFDNSQTNRSLDRIRRTTADELLALARKYLRSEDMVTVVAGDFEPQPAEGA